MSKNYTQLTEEQRYQIYSDLSAGYTQSQIAERIGVNKSTISREITRNTGLRGYRPKQAYALAKQRQTMKNQPRISSDMWELVEQQVREDLSPEQIQGWLRVKGFETVSHERIYQYIYEDKYSGGDLYRHLRCQKTRRKRYGHYDRRGGLKNRISIHDRPKVVDERLRLGDWEGDTVAGQPGGPRLVTLVDRKSRFTLMGLSPDKTAASVKATILDMTHGFQSQIETITLDNGKEFAFHEEIGEELFADIYFADPYQSHQRGFNENTNGLIRQYFPKGSDFSKLNLRKVKAVQNKLNHRPRKCLGFRTPEEVFFGLTQPVALTG